MVRVLLFVFLLTGSLSLSDTSAQQEVDGLNYLQAAASEAASLTDAEQRDEAFSQLSYAFSRVNKFQQAFKSAEQVANIQIRVYTLAFAARKATGDKKAIEEANNRANALEQDSNQIDPDKVVSDAIEKILAAAREDSDHAKSAFIVGSVVQLLIEMNRVDDAIEFTRQVPTSTHKNYGISLIASDYVKKGNPTLAFSLVDENVNPQFRESGYSTIAVALVRSGQLDLAEQTIDRISKASLRDNPLSELSKRNLADGDIDSAKHFANHVTNPYMQSHLLKQIVGFEADQITEAELKTRFESESNAVKKRELASKLTSRYILAGEWEQANTWIDKWVAEIRSHPVEQERSKFGTVDDEVRVALARLTHLDIADGYFKNGERGKALKHFEMARQAVKSIDQSAGLAKPLAANKCVQIAKKHDALNEVSFEGLSSGLTGFATKEMISLSLIREGKFKEAIENVRTIEHDHGAGRMVGSIASALLEHQRLEEAISLLKSFEDCPDIGSGYRQLGRDLRKNGFELKKDVLPKLATPLAKTHVLIGFAKSKNR